MAMFNSYVKLPEGNRCDFFGSFPPFPSKQQPSEVCVHDFDFDKLID
jgi:hypothetical protein